MHGTRECKFFFSILQECNITVSWIHNNIIFQQYLYTRIHNKLPSFKTIKVNIYIFTKVCHNSFDFKVILQFLKKSFERTFLFTLLTFGKRH